MNDLDLLRSFRAEFADEDPRPRAAAWRALEAKFDSASTVPAESPPRSRRRGFLALAGAGAAAAVIAGLVLISSGPATQSAAAEVLRRTAAVAASANAPSAGQYYFTKTKSLELEGWFADKLLRAKPVTSQPGGFNALLPVDREVWMAQDGSNRIRETLGTPRFLSSAEKSRWEEAGSPLPGAFEPRYQSDPRYQEIFKWMTNHGHVLELSRGVVDIEREGSSSDVYPDLSNVPTDPEKLRLAIQERQVPGVLEPGKPFGTEETIEVLGGLLSGPNASPALRAAAFEALAELPGIELNRNATDLVGREGYAVSYYKGHGLRGEYIFDPTSSMSLGERVVLADPTQDSEWKGYEAGQTVTDVAYLQSGVVDSTHEPAEEGQGDAGAPSSK